MPAIGHTASVSSNELIKRWRSRRKEILKTLDPKLFADYRRLTTLIRSVRVEEVKTTAIRKTMSEHREKLIGFLKECGTASRAEIVTATGIPQGSLSALLTESLLFQQQEHGRWGLKKSGASARPVK